MHKITRVIGGCFILAGCGGVQADPIQVFGATIGMTGECQVRYQKEGAAEALDPEFSEGATCRIITHDYTDVPQLVYVNGMYVLIVEANFEDGSECHSEYRALGIGREDAPKWSVMSSSGSCFFGKELHEFEYLSNTM